MQLTPPPAGDGCTGWFDGNWRDCCDLHDLAYSAQLPKGLADADLLSCVTAHGHPVVALAMYLAVTIFGWFFYLRAQAKAGAARKSADTNSAP